MTQPRIEQAGHELMAPHGGPLNASDAIAKRCRRRPRLSRWLPIGLLATAVMLVSCASTNHQAADSEPLVEVSVDPTLSKDESVSADPTLGEDEMAIADLTFSEDKTFNADQTFSEDETVSADRTLSEDATVSMDQTVGRQKTPLPDREMPGDDSQSKPKSLVLVGTTEVTPPVTWPNDRPQNPGKIHGSGEAAGLVKALELILPAGWTIWAFEDLAARERADSYPVKWHGHGQSWPDVIEMLAQQHGMQITADIAERQLVIGFLSPHEPPALPVSGSTEKGMAQGEGSVAGTAAQQPGNRLRREYVEPARLSIGPLPDTLGRVAWRLAPVGVHIDLSVLGAYVNAPVYQWDLDESFLSRRAALRALMPTGYCLDESQFPDIRAVVCSDEPAEPGDGGATGEDAGVSRP